MCKGWSNQFVCLLLSAQKQPNLEIYNVMLLLNCNGDQTIKYGNKSALLGLAKSAWFSVAWSCQHLSTTPTTDHVLSAHISTIRTWSFEILGNYYFYFMDLLLRRERRLEFASNTRAVRAGYVLYRALILREIHKLWIYPQGMFVDNEFHGQGVYTWPDGSMYSGEFTKNK